MRWLWAVATLLASLTSSRAASATPELAMVTGYPPDVPVWVQDVWQDAAIGLMESLSVERGVISGRWVPEGEGALTIVASTSGDTMSIELVGTGWRERSARGEEILTQNLAHEIAHLWQHQQGITANETRLWHEGMAEAVSMDALAATGIWSSARVRVWRGRLTRRCAVALEAGPLQGRIVAGDADAIYGCGYVVAEAAMGRITHETYADLLAGSKSAAAAQATLADALGTPFRRNLRTFLRGDFRQASGRLTIEDFRAGRL